MNCVSISVATSGFVFMIPTSSSRSAASLLNAWISPAKNFWFAALSYQRRNAADLANASPLCFTSAPMISKLFAGSFLIMSSASK